MEIKRKSQRPLGILTLVMINVIAIDSLRNLPTNAENGLTLFFFYLIATLVFFIPCIFITAELATHYPKTGGVYIWVREAFGKRWGFMTIWLQWIYNIFWYPTILSFIATNIAFLFQPALANNKIFIILMIIALFIIATMVNCYGMKLSSVVSLISAIGGTLIPMIGITILGLCWIIFKHPLALTITPQHWLPTPAAIPNLAFFVVVVFSLMGIEMSAVHAESVKNPERNYPRALLYSALIIVTTLILSSLAIAIVVPHSQLNIISGLDQAFYIFLNAFHLNWLMPIAVLFIILGGFGCMTAWVIGPTKGILVAAEDGLVPAWLSQRNRYQAPINILLLQTILVILICILFIFSPSVATAYWILSDLTAQLALLFYILMFLAAMCLHTKLPDIPKAFRIPGKPWVAWGIAAVGMMTCMISIGIGFLPPDDIQIGNIYYYETTLILGMIIFTLLPFIIDYLMNRFANFQNKEK